MDDELLDIVNARDDVVRTSTRRSVYTGGLRSGEFIRVVEILIFNEHGQLLMSKRAATLDNSPNKYDLSCGEHVRAGERYRDAALRGVQEELRITPHLVELGKICLHVNIPAFVTIYLGVHKGKLPQHNTEEIASLEWCRVEDLKKSIQQHPTDFKEEAPIIFDWYLKHGQHGHSSL